MFYALKRNSYAKAHVKRDLYTNLYSESCTTDRRRGKGELESAVLRETTVLVLFHFYLLYIFHLHYYYYYCYKYDIHNRIGGSGKVMIYTLHTSKHSCSVMPQAVS